MGATRPVYSQNLNNTVHPLTIYFRVNKLRVMSKIFEPQISIDGADMRRKDNLDRGIVDG